MNMNDDLNGFPELDESQRELFKQLAPKTDESILDLGCGMGKFVNSFDRICTLTYAIAEAGAKVIGIDRCQDNIERARRDYENTEYFKNGNLDFKKLDATQLSFTEKFDAVVSHRLIHWINEEKQKDLLDGVWQALKPGGRFVAQLYGAGTTDLFFDKLIQIIPRFNKKNNFKWYLPSPESYELFLKKCKFKKIEIEKNKLDREKRHRESFFQQVIDRNFINELSDDEWDKVDKYLNCKQKNNDIHLIPINFLAYKPIQEYGDV